MASGLTFPTLNPCISPYGLVEILNDFFLQVQTASTFNFDTFVTDGSFNGNELTLNNNQGGTFAVPWLNDLFVTGGSYDHGTSLITLANSTGATLSFSLSAITDQIDSIVINGGNDFVTGSTFDQGTGIITFTRQSGGTFTTDLSSIVDDLYSLSAVSSFDVTTGAAFNASTNEFTFNTFTGGSYSVNASSLSANTFTTGATADGIIFSHPDALILTLNNGDKVWTSLSSYTHNDYVTGGTYSSGTSLLTLTTLSGDTVEIDMGELANQSVGDDYVVSGLYDSGTSVMTLTTLSGNTVEVTGITQEDRHIFSGDVVGTSLMNFYGTNGYNFVVDVTSLSNAAQTISSGVYSGDSSSLVFYASSGGTAFVVDGLSKVTGGTYSTGTEELYLYNSTGGTLTITGFTDNYVTGGSYIASSTTIDLYDRSGNTVSIDATDLVSQSGVLAVSGGTNISTGGTQQFPIVNLNDTINLGTVNATNGNFNNVGSNSVSTVSLNATSVSTTTLNSTTGYFNVLSAETYYSGSTPFEEVIAIIATDISATTVSGIGNINVAGAILSPVVSVVDSPAFAGMSVSGMAVFNSTSATTLSGSMATFNEATATTFSSETYYSGSTPLIDIIIANAGGASTAISQGSNISTGGTTENPIISVVDSPSFNNLSISGVGVFNSVTATTLSADTVWVTNMSGMSPVNINGVIINESQITGETISIFNADNPRLIVGGDVDDHVSFGMNTDSSRGEIHFDPDDSGFDFYIVNGSTKETSAIFQNDAGALLYYDNVLRFQTTSAGGTLTSTWTADVFATEDLAASTAVVQELSFTGVTSDIGIMTTANQGIAQGEYIRTGSNTSSLTVGTVYYLNSSAVWASADASASATSINLLAVATEATSNEGMLTRGMIAIDATNFGGTESSGAPVYLSETIGRFNFSPPSTSGSIARIVGHYIESVTISRTSYFVIIFNPSHSWIEIS